MGRLRVVLRRTAGISAILIGVAVLRVRAIVTRNVVKRAPAPSLLDRLRGRLAPGRYLPRPSLDWNPVFWREWHRSRPSRWARAVNTLYFGIAAFFSLTVVAMQSVQGAAMVNGLSVRRAVAPERHRGGLTGRRASARQPRRAHDNAAIHQANRAGQVAWCVSHCALIGRFAGDRCARVYLQPGECVDRCSGLCRLRAMHRRGDHQSWAGDGYRVPRALAGRLRQPCRSTSPSRSAGSFW